MALVGCRLNEAVDLELENVNFRTGGWTLPDAKAGKRTVMLGAPALALLAAWGAPPGAHSFVKGGEPVTVNMVEHAWIGDKPQPGQRKPGRQGIRDRAVCRICVSTIYVMVSAPMPAWVD